MAKGFISKQQCNCHVKAGKSCGFNVEPEVAFRDGQNRKINMTKLQVAILAVALGLAMSARATLVYVSAAGGQLYYEGGGPAGSGTMGSLFTVSSSVTVNEAGVWDYLGAAGLIDSHEVGVWNATTGTLLDTAEVAAGTVDPLWDGFRWAPLATPLPLTAGVDYYVAAYYPGYYSQGGDLIAGGWQTVTTPPFQYQGPAYNDDTGFDANGLSSAGLVSTSNGLFSADLAAVPEPTTIISGALLLLPFGASTLRILRRRQVA